MTNRKPEYPIHDLFLNRWSPRAMANDPIPHETLMSLFEAAKWAPSSFNNQPWRFVYTTHHSPMFSHLLTTINPYNKPWAQHASVLVLVISHRFFEKTGQPSSSHSFDVGAACQNMALQATLFGLVLHLIEGFDKEQAKNIINVPDAYHIEVIAAIGFPADPAALPDHLQAREKPSDRKKLHEIVFKDTFDEQKEKEILCKNDGGSPSAY